MNPERSRAVSSFEPAIERAFVSVSLLSEISYIAMFSSYTVYFIIPTVSTTRFDAISNP